MGTQVANDQIRRPLRLSSLYDDLIDENRHPGTRLLAHRRVVADAEVAEALSVAAGTEVVFLERCRSAGSIKLAILRNWLTVTAAGELTREELEAKGLYSLIRARGVWPHFAMQRIGAVAATSGDAAILGLAAGAPLVTMRRVMQDDTGRPVELGKHVYDATHYSVEMSVLKA